MVATPYTLAKHTSKVRMPSWIDTTKISLCRNTIQPSFKKLEGSWPMGNQKTNNGFGKGQGGGNGLPQFDESACGRCGDSFLYLL